jgi:predicted house-cleaning noncanonical NTP pyrophosphatase (MazG superfamily)
MRIEYHKLIRDRIPEIIARDGKTYETEVMGLAEYQQALLTKLVEEAQEAAAAKPDKLMIELADLMEVFQATLQAFEILPEEVRSIQQERQANRGGFDQRLKLLWVEE